MAQLSTSVSQIRKKSLSCKIVFILETLKWSLSRLVLSTTTCKYANFDVYYNSNSVARLRGTKTKEITSKLRDGISFVLLPQDSEPSQNWNKSKLAYCCHQLTFQSDEALIHFLDFQLLTHRFFNVSRGSQCFPMVKPRISIRIKQSYNQVSRGTSH